MPPPDIRRLSRKSAAELINATPLGEITSADRLGQLIKDGAPLNKNKTINLIDLAAWLIVGDDDFKQRKQEKTKGRSKKGRTINPGAIEPEDLATMLNNIVVGGNAVNAVQLATLRQKFYWLGPDNKIAFLRFVAFLLKCREEGYDLSDPDNIPDIYAPDDTESLPMDERERQNQLMRKKRTSARNIGELPKVKDAKRKESCRFDLEKFLLTYLIESFPWPFSDGHKRVIKKLERAIIDGGRFANLVYRGFGKTTIAEGAALWAIIYGHRKFAVIIGADTDSAKGNLDSIKSELEENDYLFEDFPEICYPIRALEGIHHRCAGQLYRGELTHIEWKGDTLVMPMIAGSAAAGSLLGSRGITSRIRGWKKKRRDGVQLRPDFAILDDIQTDESASTEGGVKKRIDIIKKAVLKLAGHDTTISCVANLTIIQKGDVADQLSDPEKNPSWLAEKIPLLIKPADNEDVWLEDYAELRNTYDRDDPTGEARKAAILKANEYYLKNRKRMDAGAIVEWTHCYNHEFEHSSIQHAYNSLIDDGPEVFASEMQQEPIDLTAAALYELDPDVIARRVNGLPRFAIHGTAPITTAFIDVGWRKLNFVCTAWENNLTGHVFNYGEYPHDEKISLFDSTTGMGYVDGQLVPCSIDEAITAGLKHVLKQIFDMDLRKPDGEAVKLDYIGIDCGDPGTRQAVIGVCQGERFDCPVVPSRGRAHHKFRIPKNSLAYHHCFREYWKSNGANVFIHDACMWREWAQRACMVPEGGNGAIRLFGNNKTVHETLAAHICSEKLKEKVFTNDGEKYVWEESPINHYLDCLVGTAVMAGIVGARPAGIVTKLKQKSISLAQIQRQKKRNRA